MLPDSMNSETPPETPAAISQSAAPYEALVRIMPQIMTGIIFMLFPRRDTGNDTYFKHSYWLQVAATFEKEMAKYIHSGALCRNSSPLTFIIRREYIIPRIRPFMTRNTDSLKNSPSYGTAMIRSWRTP